MKKVVVVIIAIKIWTLVLIFLAFNLLPFAVNYYSANFHYPTSQRVGLHTAYKTWDAEHYLFLAEKGYAKGQESNRFYPLFPFLIRVVSYVTHNTLFSGLLLSNIFSFLGLLFFYLFVKDNFRSERIAFLSVLLFLAFPTSFYLSLVYSESLFVCLSAGFFYYLFRNEFGKSSILAILLPLTRPVGIFIVVPYLAYVAIKDSGKIGEKITMHLRVNQKFFLGLTPLLGFALYLFIMYMLLGSPFAGFLADKTSIGNWDIANIFDPTHIIATFFTPNLAIHGFTNSILDRLFFIFFLSLLPLIYQKTNLVLFLYAVMLGLVPVFGSFMSYSRYLMPALPIYIVCAILFITSKRFAALLYPYLFISIGMQTLFILMHSLNYWVS